MKSPNILSDIVPVNNDQTVGTVWSPFKEGYFNKIIMSSGAGTNYDYDGSSNYTSMDLPEEEIKGAAAPSPWTSPENFFISGGSPGYWNRTDAGNRPGGHLGIRSGRNSYIEKSDGTFAETTSKPGIGFYVSKFGADHPAASGTAEIKFYGYDEIAVMDNNSIRVDRPLVPYTNEKTNIGDASHKFNEAHIKNVKGNATTATTAEKLGTSAGGTAKPIYFKDGKPAETGYTFADTISSSATDNNKKLPTSSAVVDYVGSTLRASDAMIYKGTIGTGGTVEALPSTTALTGWTYKVITAGTYAGVSCEVGDMIICLTDGSSTKSATWTVVQSNIDGAVTSGVTSATDGHIPLFSGATGKVIKSSSKAIVASITGTENVPTDKAVKDYVDPLISNINTTIGDVETLLANI